MLHSENAKLLLVFYETSHINIIYKFMICASSKSFWPAKLNILTHLALINSIIVFVWSQYDGENIDKEVIVP